MGDDNCRVYAGNLSFNTDQDTLLKTFKDFGNVTECKLITDRETDRSRGFAFITFDCPESANNAVANSNFELDGREVKVSIAQARGDRSGGGGRGGGYRGGRGGGGGYDQQRSYGGGDRYGGGGDRYGGGGDRYGGGGQSYGGSGGYGGDSYSRQGGGW